MSVCRALRFARTIAKRLKKLKSEVKVSLARFGVNRAVNLVSTWLEYNHYKTVKLLITPARIGAGERGVLRPV